MILDKFRLDGKTALVTGAGSGLGRAMALALAEAGADVATLGRRKEALAETVRKIRERGRRGIALPADVSDAGRVKEAVEQTETELGPIDVLVNAAGVFNGEDSLTLSPEAWRYVLEINLTGTFLCAQAAGAGMVVRGRGSIVNVGTFMGERGHRMARAAYNASKWGVIALTRSLSVDWGRYGVRVNCISPGAHRTPMLAPGLKDPEEEDRLRRKTVLGRVGEPEDIAGLCVFLASDASSYITGENIHEDGGGWL